MKSCAAGWTSVTSESIYEGLRSIADALRAAGKRFAVVVVVSTDAEMEALAFALTAKGYRTVARVEHEARGGARRGRRPAN